MTTIDPNDIAAGDWVDRHLPASWRPYARLARWDRPVGWWLLLLPCWWGAALAWTTTPITATGGAWGNPWAFAGLCGLFLVGAVAMRGAGCTVNDLADRDFDRQVARTRTRPLASGALSTRQAAAFLALQCLVGLGVLAFLNPLAWVLAGASVALVVAYPFMKRITYWPQAFLGLTFNWGVLIAWAAVAGDLAWPALALYGAGICWTLGYDTIYAHQDKADDILIGVKSTALKFGAATRAWVAGFYGATIALVGLAGALAGVGWPFWPLLAAAAGHFAWQVATVDIDDPRNCLARFKANRWVGSWLAAALLIGGLSG